MAKAEKDPTGVALPAGTGFSSGLGESFNIDLNTGQGTYSVPIELPRGVAGFGPTLRLQYSSAFEQGPFGMGWRIPVREIRRRLDTGIPAEGEAVGLSEVFLDGSSELVAIGDDGTFGTARETSFTRYRFSDGGWRLVEKNGVVHEIGTTAAGRIADAWLLERSIDPSGNEVRYEYSVDQSTPYLASVRYAVFSLRFTYVDRPDIRYNGRAGVLRTLARRCARIELWEATTGVERHMRTWQLGYAQHADNGASLLSSVQLTGHGPATDGSGDVSRPALRFSYGALAAAGGRISIVDHAAESPPPSLVDADVTLAALDGLPLAGVLQIVNGQAWYWQNEGDLRFGAARPLGHLPAVRALRRDGVAFADMDGNGTLDVLVAGGAEPLHGYYENAGGAEFSRFVHYPRARAGEPPLTSRAVRMVDLDGDGRVDALTSRGRAFAWYRNHGGEGWSGPLCSPMGRGEDRPDVDFGDPLVRLADMTGDGMPDLVRIRSGCVEYWPNLGHGRFGARRVMTGSPRLSGISARPDELILADLDGDGVADLARVSTTGIDIWINQGGNGYRAPIHEAMLPPPIPGTLHAVDMRGHGRSALLWCARHGRGTAYVVYELTSTETPYRLREVDHATGLTSSIRYKSALSDALAERSSGTVVPAHLPFPLTVVESTRDQDVTSGRTSEVRFSYHGGYFDPRTRQFEGFSRVEKIEVGDASQPDARHVHHFLVGEDRRPGAAPEQAQLNGFQSRIELFGPEGLLRVEESEPAVTLLGDGLRRAFVAVQRHRVRHLDGGTDERVEEHSYEYDAAGNVIRDELRAFGTVDGVAQPEQREILTLAFATGRDGKLTDRVAHAFRRDGAGRLLSEMHRHYDGEDFVGLALGQSDRGLETRTLELVLEATEMAAHYAPLDPANLGYVAGVDADGNSCWFRNKTRVGYDARGVKVADLDPMAHLTRYVYDQPGLFVVEKLTARGTVRTRYDIASAQPVEVLDPAGNVARMTFDALGRVTRVVLPGHSEAFPTRVYRYDESVIPGVVAIDYRLVAGAPELLSTAVYYDGAGKELERRVTRESGVVIVSGRRELTAGGQVAVEHEPSLASSLAYTAPAPDVRPVRRFFYDAAGRPTRVEGFADGATQRIRYAPFGSVTTDPLGRQRAERYDVRHRRVAVVEAAESANLESRFRLGGLGELTAFEDQHGVAASYRYDCIGNRLAIVHRDAGERRLAYDAGGRVVRTTDGNGRELSARYDDLGRLMTVSSDGGVVEEYRWDNAENGWGRLEEVTYPGGGQRFSYYPDGQIKEHEYSFDGEAATRRVAYEYDALGHEVKATLPGGAVVEQEYYTNGLLKRVPGYVDSIEYDARNLPTRIRYANGVTTELAHTAGIGRVDRQRIVGPAAEVFFDETYRYDAGEMLAAVERPGSATTRLGYDGLGQLVSMGADGETPTSYGFAGRELLSLGETNTQLTLDPAHSGRVATMTVGTAAPFSLQYDLNGNLAGLPGRAFSYDHKSQLVRCQRSDGTLAEYRYDHGGRRTWKRVTKDGATTTTLSIGDRVEIRDGEVAFYIFAGEMRVAVVAGGTTRYLHSDYLGSVRFFSDESGRRIAGILHRPFGNAAEAGESATPRIYAMHPYDAESGLYYMGRRHYAPELGRFTTPDPLYLHRPERSQAEPRTLALYGYAFNDPINHVDPDGLSGWSVLGAILGAIVGIIAGILFIAACATGVGFVVLAIIGIIAVVTAGYLAARFTDGAWRDFFKGFLIGFNAGLSTVLAAAAFTGIFWMLGVGVFTALNIGIGIGITIGIINFLAAFDFMAQSEVFQGILGWTSWFNPMSWVVNAIGLAAFVVNGLFALCTGQQVDFLKIQSIQVDWKTGTFFMKGGLISNLNTFHTAFNLGSFGFIDRANPYTDAQVIEHEAGHNLSLAAFGSIFHFVGMIDEQASGGNAFAELLAEGNVPSTTFPNDPTWS